MYHLLFLNIFIGLLSSVARQFKNFVFAVMMFGRIDRSVVPDGFQRFDSGEFIGFLSCFFTHVRASNQKSQWKW